MIRLHVCRLADNWCDFVKNNLCVEWQWFWSKQDFMPFTDARITMFLPFAALRLSDVQVKVGGRRACRSMTGR